MASLSSTPTTVKAQQNTVANILFVTLGCAKNEVDTDRMRALLFGAGFGEATSTDDADAVIINTCSFLASATSESIETTLDLADAAHAGVRKKPIVMCGCVPSRYGASLDKELPEVAAFVKADEEDNIVSVMCEVLDVEPQVAQSSASAMDLSLRTIEGTSAFVKISEGCDRMCAFCAIPYIRGRYHSRHEDEIMQEVRSLMEGGVKEIVLIGQDTGIWGSDFDEPKTLAYLLKQVAKTVSVYDGWVRVLYLQPEGMTDELIATIRDTKEVLPYIDIPIQHSSARILRRMRRSGSIEELRELFLRLRKEIPNMVLRTTGLVGFPGETEEEFEELMSFFKEMEFDYMSVFPYSQEEGTLAASLDDQIDEETKLDRCQRLLDVAEQLGFAATAKHVGEVVDVIIDGIEDTEDGLDIIGHTWFQAPDCDGAVHIVDGDVAVGDVVSVRLVDSFCYELIGELV